jgi:uncharacterized protein
MAKGISRREVLRQTASVTALGLGGILPAWNESISATPTLPRRLLGKTGVRVSQLTFGCGSRFVNGFPTDEKALEVLEYVLGQGINYFDSAHSYGDGESERRLGLFLKKHRKEVFLVTKLEARDGEGFKREFELSLKRLGTDHLDLLHIHGINDLAEVDKIGQKDGVFQQLLRLKEEKSTRFIGFSCHTDGTTARAAIEKYEFDCCMLQLNAARVGSFEQEALPSARKKGMGIIAMKATAQEKLLGAAPGKAGIEELLRYALSLPVAGVNLGMPSLEMVRQNLELARNWTPMPLAEMEGLHTRVASSQAALNRFFQAHDDCLPA